ncbi:ClpP/crotonase-like domain-containing protein [Ochromonadaceae sp. CCMP2298]|nr:ClpP/crotonase-like domain-containing protein [Ochromonadaceae sp. CCMP2298]|mmetsp:Transcript_25782/g.57085  ORF Transcript_25782/g.57085 Transcript_25782/m.57085 type:complete len:477 (+) Transcript_25782:368-1798(+)
MSVMLLIRTVLAMAFMWSASPFVVRIGPSGKQLSITARGATAEESLADALSSSTALRIRRFVAGCLISGGLLCTGGAVSPAIAAEHPVFDEVWGIVNENFFDPTYNKNDWSKVREDYQKRLDSGADEDKLTKKMLSLLGDKYTRLLDKQFFESLWKYDAIGVGLLFQSDPGKNMYVSAPPIDSSSGAKAGIRKGDVIYAINGERSDKMTAIQMLDKMSNDERDSLELEYGTPSETGAEVRKTVQLARSTEKAVNPVTFSSKKLPDGKTAGYVKLKEFNAEAVPQLKKALVALNAQGIDELALDLRGNTGGGFQFALNVGGMFMQDKHMVTAAGRGDDTSVFRTSYPEGVLFSKPLVIITDGLSASASEVLVAGLHDNCRAAVTGSKTFGKGKIQAVFGLANGEGVTMTVAQYVSPSGAVIQSKGIEPDLPMSTINPYINALTGSILEQADVDRVDFQAAQKLLSVSCPAILAVEQR